MADDFVFDGQLRPAGSRDRRLHRGEDRVAALGRGPPDRDVDSHGLRRRGLPHLPGRGARASTPSSGCGATRRMRPDASPPPPDEARRSSAARRPLLKSLFRTRSRPLAREITMLDLGSRSLDHRPDPGGERHRKDRLARALHDASSRRDRPFVRVEAANLSDDLFESELFGHERARSPERCPASAGCWRWRRTAPSISTRSPRCRSRARPSFCACCKSGRFGASEASSSIRSARAWSSRRGGISRSSSARSCSGTTSSTGSTSYRCRCPGCRTGPRTFSRWRASA